jgi:hypothetical protein
MIPKPPHSLIPRRGKKKLAPDFNPGNYVENIASRRAATNDEKTD